MSLSPSLDRPTVLGRIKAKPPLRGGRSLAFASKRALTQPPCGGPDAVRFARNAGREEDAMLKVYGVMIGVLHRMRGVLVQIEKRDRDLGSQLRRAASSVALNIAEGSGSVGGTRLARYRTALGSARETVACLEVAVALGYVEKLEPEVMAQVDEVLRMLVALVR